TTDNGDLLKITVPSPGSPSILQIAKINSGAFFGSPNSIAYDGTNIHVANGIDGYTVLPFNLSAPPREDPSHGLRTLGPQAIVGICPGSLFPVPAHFVPTPAITSFQWLKYNRTTFLYDPIANGPTGSGSTISGATTATLNISNPGGADAAFYRCRATNS